MERHPLDLVSLVGGLAAVALGITELVGDVTDIDWGLALPIGVLVLGAVVIAGARRSRRGDRTEA